MTGSITAGPDTGVALIVWACIGVDYANEGAENDPSTLTYANVVDDTRTLSTSLGDKIVAALPTSAESNPAPVLEAVTLPQYRHHLTVQSHRRWVV
jgi:hypothetical protein